MIGIIGIIILLFVMIVLKMPVGFSMAVVGFGGLWYVTGLNSALSMMGTETWSNFSSYGLTVIPLFILMGTICFHSGVNKNLYNTAYKWFGRTRGGIAMATVMACAGFAAICGSNNATAATMTTVALPEMRKYNYNKALSAGMWLNTGSRYPSKCGAYRLWDPDGTIDWQTLLGFYLSWNPNDAPFRSFNLSPLCKTS